MLSPMLAPTRLRLHDLRVCTVDCVWWNVRELTSLQQLSLATSAMGLRAAMQHQELSPPSCAARHATAMDSVGTD